jgi:hypothetical protein
MSCVCVVSSIQSNIKETAGRLGWLAKPGTIYGEPGPLGPEHLDSGQGDSRQAGLAGKTRNNLW